MPLKQARQVASGAPVPSLRAGVEVFEVTGDYTVKATDLANDVIELGGIPSGAIVVDMIIHHDGVGGTADAGILSGEYGSKDNARTCGQEFGAALSLAAAGVVRLAKNTNGVAATANERGWGVKLLGAPTAGKVIRATLLVVAQGV
jgi:hypothetical protein